MVKKKLPWRAKPRLPCGPETGAKSDLTFCLWSLLKKQTVQRVVQINNDYEQIEMT